MFWFLKLSVYCFISTFLTCGCSAHCSNYLTISTLFFAALNLMSLFTTSMSVLFSLALCLLPPTGPASDSFYRYIHWLFSVHVHTISGCTSNLPCFVAQNVYIFHSWFCYFNHRSPFQMTFHISKSISPSLLSNLTHRWMYTLCFAFATSRFCISQLLAYSFFHAYTFALLYTTI